MKRIITIILLFAIAGCEAVPMLGKNKRNTDKADIPRERVPDSPLPESEPFLRIISGRKIDSVAELQQAISSEQTDIKSEDIDNIKLDVVNFRDMELQHASLMLTRMINRNVVVSSEIKNRKISIYLKNVSARAAIEGLCRLNKLWYREDPEMIRILSEEEYGKELVVRRDEQTRLYYLKNASAPAVAEMISSLMPQQVEYEQPDEERSYGHVGTDGDDPMESDSSSSTSNSNNNNNSHTYNDDNDGSNRVSRSSYRFSPSDLNSTFSQGIAAGRQRSVQENRNIDKSGEIKASSLVERGGISAPVTISVFLRNNCIGVRTVQESMHREIGKLIESLDTSTRQVLLEVKVMRITLGDSDESLFNLSYGGGGRVPEVTTDSGITYRPSMPNGISSAPDATEDGVVYRNRKSGSIMGGADLAGSTVSFTYLNNNITATMKMLKSDRRLRVIATPMLLCANNAPAEFFSGVTRMITTNYDYETRYGDNNQAVDIIRPIVEEREIGTKVRIKPSINSDGTVTLRFLLEVGSVNENGGSTYQVKDGDVIKLPIDTVDNEKVESIVVGKHGQAVVMGGLISESKTKTSEKMPGLGDIPVVRRLFGKYSDSKTRNETIIVIVPHIIANAEKCADISKTLMKNNSAQPWIQNTTP